MYNRIKNIVGRLFGKGKSEMNQGRPELPNPLLWLADAPLFIDSDQVSRFYDAIARPKTKGGTTTVEMTEETAKELSGKLGLEVGIETGKLAGLLLHALAFVKPSAKVTAEGEASKKTSEGSSVSYELIPVETPQSQLEALTFLYLTNYPKRVFFADFKSSADWRDPKSISAVPRSLVFLDLPSYEDAAQKGIVQTKLIPTAAEFENGKIVPIYPELVAKNGERPPKYPEPDASEKPEQLLEKRKVYWQWFEKNFSAVSALNAVENAASENGKIRWIDYRLPLTADGDTLHLHVCPRASYDTGVLAYNFLKRGSKHGLRLVGTLKSEPDLNVLAIYEK
jgi:hypothetical protein